jgi:hypothetical protein
VYCDFEQGNRAAVVEICNVGFGVEVLARDVAVVGGFVPVPAFGLSAVRRYRNRFDLRIVDNDLAFGVPARKLQIRILIQICHGVASQFRTDSAFGLIFQRCVFEGEVLFLRSATAVCEVFGVWTMRVSSCSLHVRRMGGGLLQSPSYSFRSYCVT